MKAKLLILLLAGACLAVPLGDNVQFRVDFEGPVLRGSEGELRTSAMRLERSVDGGPWLPAERVENLDNARVVLYRGVY